MIKRASIRDEIKTMRKTISETLEGQVSSNADIKSLIQKYKALEQQKESIII